MNARSGTPSPSADWVDDLSFNAEVTRMPPLQGGQACIADASWALSPAMQGDCRAALAHVASADTLIERMVATGMLETMARDDREGSKWRWVHRELRCCRSCNWNRGFNSARG